MRIEIITAEPRHLVEIVRIEQENFPAPCWSTALFERKLEDPSVRFLLAEAEGHVLGFAVLQYMPPEAELQDIAVDRTVQDRGIGRQLITRLLEECVRADVTAVHLDVRAGNDRAIALYSSLGFEAVGRRSGYYRNTDEDAILMTATCCKAR